MPLDGLTGLCNPPETRSSWHNAFDTDLCVSMVRPWPSLCPITQSFEPASKHQERRIGVQSGLSPVSFHKLTSMARSLGPHPYTWKRFDLHANTRFNMPRSWSSELTVFHSSLGFRHRFPNVLLTSVSNVLVGGSFSSALALE